MNAATNRINGDSYDANGNLTSSPQGGGHYDGENRLVTSGGDTYSYGPDNLRVYKQHSDGEELIFALREFSGLAQVARRKFIGRVPAVYLTSAVVAILAFLFVIEINNLRVLRAGS